MATAQERPATYSIPAKAIHSVEVAPEGRHRILLELTNDMTARIDDLVQRTGYDQGELFDIAISFFKVGLDAVEGGRRVGVIDDDRDMALDLTGFHKNDPPGESF